MFTELFDSPADPVCMAAGLSPATQATLKISPLKRILNNIVQTNTILAALVWLLSLGLFLRLPKRLLFSERRTLL